MSASSGHAASQTAAATAQAETGGGVFKSIGGAVSNTVKGVGDDISESYQGIKESVGSRISNTPSNIADTPIAPGVSTPDIAGQASTKDTDGLTKSLESITGIRTNELFPEDAIPSTENLQATLEDFLAVVKRQVAAELKHCIEKYLAWLRNKYELLDILLDLEGYIQRMIAEQRLKLQRKIRAELEKLINQKLKMYQIALMRQKLLSAIRKLCPKIPSKGTHSPTWIRRLQSDPTWQVVDGETPLYVSVGSNPQTAAAFDDPNNAGQVFENTINDIMDQVLVDVQSQLAGSGGVAPKSKQYKVITEEEMKTASITKFAHQGLNTDEIIERMVEEYGEGCRDKIIDLVKKICH